MTRILLITLLMIYSISVSGQTQAVFSSEIEAVLNKSGKNRTELEKALLHFKKKKDPLQIKAINFLIANMDIHVSMDYYWADSKGGRLSFNELDYPDFSTAVKAFEELKRKHGKLKPIPFSYKDIDSIKGDYLIENVEMAFAAWKNKSSDPKQFQYFCEYLLPYRTSIEPLQNWRKKYNSKFAWIDDTYKQKGSQSIYNFTLALEKSSFTNAFGFESRKEPLPRLGALQLLQRKKGPCEDIADFKAFVLRSQGIPASVESIPFWGTSSGGHFFSSTFDEKLKPLSLEVLKEDVPEKQLLPREPAKVIRSTYSKQKNTLAAIEKTDNIPPGFLRTLNYLDVTDQYWKTGDLKCSLYENTKPQQIVYACVFNYGKWQPIWWGKSVNRQVSFTKMTQGVVYLPALFVNGRIQSAGYPVALINSTQNELKPNLSDRRSINLKWQDKYLVLQKGKKYRLYYWDKSWKLLAEKVAGNNDQLSFENVPQNALLLLRPEYSRGKERPFFITKTGKRIWW